MNGRGRRILMVTSSYPLHRGDMHAFFVHDMARNLVQRGAAVHVVTLAVPEQRHARETVDDVTVERVPYPGLHRAPITGAGGGLIGNLRRRPWRALALAPMMVALVAGVRAAARRFRPDGTIAHWLVPGGLAAASVGVPAVFIAHSSEVHLLGRIGVGRDIVASLQRRGAVVATSNYLRRRMQELSLLEDCPVMTLGVRHPPSLLRPPAAPRRIAWMGRMVEGKGLFELLEVLQSAPALHATFAGQGPLRDALIAEVERRGMAGRVAVRAPVIDAEKHAFFASHHLFAFVPDPPASGAFQDNLPVVCLEALAHGVPVVASRVGALPELLSTGAGVVVEGAAQVRGALQIDNGTLHRWQENAERLGFTITWDRCFNVLLEQLDAQRGRPLIAGSIVQR